MRHAPDSVLDPGDFEAERQVILEEINMHEDAPDDVVHDLFAETVWSEHPLGRPVLGRRDDLAGRTATRSGGSTAGTTSSRTWSWWRRATWTMTACSRS